MYKKILNNQNLNFATKSISALHIVKAHPLFIKRKINLFFIFKIIHKLWSFFFYVIKSLKLSFYSEDKLPKRKF